MITVKLEPGRMTVCGHAGYAPAGQDIVCAAVSTVVEMCEATLQAFGCDWDEADDGTTVAIAVHSGVGQVILQAAGRVLRDLAVQYPEHVRVQGKACEERHAKKGKQGARKRNRL